MGIDWAERIRKRNRVMLIGSAVVLFVFLAIFGLHLSNALFVSTTLWYFYFVAVHLRWKADPKGGGIAIRKELLRQGTLFKHGWAWFCLPALVGAWPGHSWTWAIILPLLVWSSIDSWRKGETLIQRAND